LLYGISSDSIGCGTVDATLSTGGTRALEDEEMRRATRTYNGTSWSASAGTPTTMYYHQGCGTLTAALMISGINRETYQGSYRTDHYNGTSWSPGGNVIVARKWGAATGTTDAAILFDGRHSSSDGSAWSEQTEHYNGTSWSSGGNAIVPRASVAGCGTVDAALNAGGNMDGAIPGNEVSSTEVDSYNGTSWSVEAGLPIVVSKGEITGTVDSALRFGGSQDKGLQNETDGDKTFVYDGASWSVGANMLVGRWDIGASGTSTSALNFEGDRDYLVTEEYVGTPTRSTASTNRSGVGVWASRSAILKENIGPVLYRCDEHRW